MSQWMQAIRLDEIGPPDNLRYVKIERPQLAEDGVLIRVAYAGLIYADAEARRGAYFKNTILPWFPGREVTGVVEATGSAVKDFKPGDRVSALIMDGGCYAEFVQARTIARALPNGKRQPASDIVRLPDSVSFTQALVYHVNFRLAHLLFHAWARPRSGAHVLIHGAAGGMGSMLVQIATAHRCRVTAIVRSDAEAAFCRELGVARAIDNASGDYASAAQEEARQAPIQYSFNGVGGETVRQDCTLLAPLGELLCFGSVAGKRPVDFFALNRSLVIKSFSANDFFGTPAFAEATDAMHAWFQRGPLLDVGRVFPLAEAAAAHRALEAGDFVCKIALQPAS